MEIETLSLLIKSKCKGGLVTPRGKAVEAKGKPRKQLKLIYQACNFSVRSHENSLSLNQNTEVQKFSLRKTGCSTVQKSATCWLITAGSFTRGSFPPLLGGSGLVEQGDPPATVTAKVTV